MMSPPCMWYPNASTGEYDSGPSVTSHIVCEMSHYLLMCRWRPAPFAFFTPSDLLLQPDKVFSCFSLSVRQAVHEQKRRLQSAARLCHLTSSPALELTSFPTSLHLVNRLHNSFPSCHVIITNMQPISDTAGRMLINCNDNHQSVAFWIG